MTLNHPTNNTPSSPLIKTAHSSLALLLSVAILGCASSNPSPSTPSDVATEQKPNDENVARAGGQDGHGSEGAAAAPAANAPKIPVQRVEIPKDAKPMEAHAPDPTSASKSDSKSEGKPAPEREPKEMAPAEFKNTIRWSTASEVDNFGYDVYRGDGPDGPFERLTARPIQGAGTSDETHKYEYTDTTIDPTRDYWYFVESISISGVRERFTPVSKAKAKTPKKEG